MSTLEELKKTVFSNEFTTIDAITAKPGPNGQHILVCSDMSPDSFEALKFAIQKLSHPNDVLTVFVVLDPRDLYKADTDRETYRQNIMVDLHKKVKELLITFEKSLIHRVNAEWGEDARNVILNKIKQGYGMVVVGSRGMSALEGIVVGSVSTFLLNQSPVPVIVVKRPIDKH
ncbi:hypothetical protein HK103_007376 [Boothiomyces macroporosus]|uniref:UspA domain-containing protein n=1 Tax=Boothiomyces macroporosus TaxID=261099 RepID=A0AAD5YAC6_9FUNG|nr:hypothetical protein HK103_007376 [Boothiomyces macroporosus]